jgi:hypothetical protein
MRASRFPECAFCGLAWPMAQTYPEQTMSVVYRQFQIPNLTERRKFPRAEFYISDSDTYFYFTKCRFTTVRLFLVVATKQALKDSLLSPKRHGRRVARHENIRSYMPILEYWKQIYFTSVIFEPNPRMYANKSSTVA